MNSVATDEMVNVYIVASQIVHYRQTVTMKRSEWEKIKETPDREMRDNDGPLSSQLDLMNPCDADDFDIDQMVVVDADGKIVKPVDAYEG